MSNCPEHMSEKKLSEYKTTLIELKRNTVEKIEQINASIKESNGKTADQLDAASINEQRTQSHIELIRNQSTLKRIKKVLEEFDDFGYCNTCGVEIPTKRLDIFPYLDNCVNCQNILDIKNKHHAR